LLIGAIFYYFGYKEIGEIIVLIGTLIIVVVSSIIQKQKANFDKTLD